MVILIASILSGILYRLGGWEKGNKLFRRLGCPLVALLTLWLLVGVSFRLWWVYLLFVGLSYGALTTYWDFTGSDNFYLHGLGVGLAGIPLIWCGVPLHYILIRIVICSVGMGLWSKWIGNDIAEESGRGVLFIL
jgi:FtsH-binding integral membrane protein